MGSYIALHPFRRQVEFRGASRDGSSDSDSGGAGLAVFDGGVMAGGSPGCDTLRLLVATVTLGAGRSGSALPASDVVAAGFLDSVVGVSSMVECLPVVQGGMTRNSSKVKTRGLQHFHPGHRIPTVRERLSHIPA